MSVPFRQGDVLPELVREVTQAGIRRYADASGDYNPIHIDEKFAASTPLGGTIAHGMLVLAYMSEMMCSAFGPGWDENGHMSVRFKSPARPGDTLTVSGAVESVKDEDGIVSLTCSLSCRNQDDVVVVAGDARVTIPV
ncbi:MAG: MaoC family dehydratase [Chloroflexota bacterium]